MLKTHTYYWLSKKNIKLKFCSKEVIAYDDTISFRHKI